MYFNRKNSQQKNWRMIKKGKHFLFGCALVFTLGATANVASAETIVSEVTTVDQAQDSTAASEDADSEAAASTTAVSEVASSITTTSEAASETVSTSTVASSEASETTSTASEVAVSESSEASTVASSEVSETSTSSETATSTTAEAVSEVSTTVSASETAVANRTAFIGYEVQYTTSSGEVVGKTANIVAADTTEAVATSTLTVAATDVPAGYELAAEQAYSLTQQISENQINILSFAVVKKSEEEEIAESQLANKAVLEQVLSEATLLSEEALRLVATTQAGNTTLEAAATATQETADKATLVFEDAAATQEQVDSQVEAVKASTLALAEEMLKVDADGVLTVSLNTTGTSISSTRGYGTTDNVISNYEVRDGYVYWTHQFNNGYANTNYYNYFFTIPKSVGAMEDLVVTQYNQDGTVRSTSNSWPDGEGAAGAITPNIGSIGNGYFDKKGLDEGRANAPLYDNNNHIASAIDRTGFAGSDAILNNSQSEYYVLNSNRRTNRLTRWVVSYRTPIVDENGSLDYIAGGSSNIKADNNDVVVGTYGALYKEVPEFYNQQKVDKGQAQNQLNDMLVWRNTEMTTPYQLPIKDNGVAIDEIYYVLADTAATEKITVDNLTISNTGVVTGSASFTGEPKTIEAVIKSGDTLVQSEQAWIVVMDAQGSTINKNEGETVSNEEILNKVTVDWGGYDPTWEFGEAGLTKEVITPTLPTSGQNNVVQVKLTNAQGQEKIVDVIVNWPVTNQATTGTNKKPLYVFNNTPIATVGAGTDAADNVNKVNVVTLEDPQGINLVEVTRETDVGTAVFNPSSIGITIDTDGNASGTPSVGPIGVYSRGLTVTDGTGAKTNLFPRNNEMETYVLDATAGATITKAVGESVTEAEILDNVTVATGNSSTFDAAIDSRYRKVLAPGQQVPTTPGTHTVNVRVITESNVYKDVPVTVVIPENQATTGTNKKPLYVFNNTPIATVGAGTDVADNVNKVNVVTLEDPQGINSVEVTRETDVGTAVFNPSSIGITIDTDGNASGTPSVGPIGVYSRGLTVTDGTGAKTNLFPRNNEMETYVLDATAGATITKAVGESVTEAEILDNVTVSTGNSSTFDAAIDSRYRKVLAPDQTLPTTEGTHTVMVRVITESNVYKDVPVTVIIPKTPDTTAPEAPVVDAKEDGSVTVTPAGDDTKTTAITYTDENGTPQTVTVTKGEDGNWTVPAESGVTVDPSTGAVTIPADKVQDGSTVSATSTDEAGNTSSPATDIAKDNPDTTAPEAPVVTANPDGTVTVTPSTTAGDDTKTVDITYTDENGTPQKVTVTKGEDGNWTVPAESGVTVDPSTGAVTIPADKVQDGSTVSATSTDEAGNTSSPATDTAKNNPDTTAPEAPSVVANDDGTVTVTPSTTAGDDTKTVDITYTDENGTPQKVTVTKGEDGNWTVPADSGVTVDPTTGAVTIPADKVQDGSTVSATSTDEAGNTSSPATDTAKNNPDTTAPEAPSVVANDDGTVTVTPSTTAGDDTKTVDITYTDENGTTQTVTVTKGEDGNWKVPADSGVTVDPTTGAVTIPADKVQDGSTVSATSTDAAGNTSSPATDTAKNNPDTTAPESPSVVANEDGTVTVTPSTTAGDDTKTVDITYTDENGTTQTVTVTKGEDGNWKVPADSGVTVDPTTGAVTIPADKVQDGSTVSATSTDAAGNTSSPATDTAKNDPDTTAPEAPVVTANPDGTVTVTPSTTTGDDTKTVDITYTDENGTPQKVTVTKGEDGTWTVPSDSGVTVDPSTGAVTIPADKVQDGSTVSATSTDEAGNTSSPATDTANNNPDTIAPEAPVVNAPKEGDTTVTGTTEPGATVTVTFPDGSTVTTTADEDGNYTVDVPAGVELKEGDKVTATATDEAGNTSTPTESTTTANPSDADENTPNTPAVTPVENPSNLTDDEKAKVKEEVEKANPDLPTGTEVTVGNDGTVTVKYPDGSTDTIPGTDAVTPITDTTAPEAPVVNAPKEGDTTVTGTTEPGATVTVTFPDGSTVTTTADEDGNYTVDVPAGVELKEGDKVTATATDEAGNVSEPTESTTTANPSDADENTPNTPAVTPVEDPNNLTDDEKAKVKEEVEKANPGLPTGTEVTVGNDGTVTVKYPDGSVDTIPGTDTVTPITDTTAPEAPAVNAPKEGDTTVTGTTEPGATVTVTFPDGSTVTTTADEDGNYTVDVPAGVELKEGDKVTATATDKAGNVSEPTEATTTANPSDADENTPNTPAVTPVEDTNNLTDDEKAKVKEEVEKANPDLPTGTEVTVGNDGTVTITYPDGSVDTIPGTDTVTPITDTTAPEAPVVNAPKEGDTTVTGTTEPGATVTVTFPDGSTVTTTADEDGNYTVDVPAGVELKEGDKVTATATDEAGNVSEPTEATTTANPSDADENTPNTPAVTPVEDPNNLTDDEKAKVKEEVEKVNPDLPTGTEVTVGNDGTVTIKYPDGSVDTIPGTDTVTPITDTTAPEAPVVNAPKEGDTTVTGTTEPGATVTVTFPDGSTVTTTADEDGNYTVDVPAGVELKEGDKVTATATDEAGNVSEPTEATTTANPSDADENTPNTPAVTPVGDTNNLTEEEKVKVKEEVETANPDLPTGTEVTVGNDGTVTIKYPDGSVDTIPGTDTVTPITDTTAPEAPVVNAPKEGDTTVTGTTEPGATVTVTFPDGSTVTTTADEDGNYTVDVPAGVELKEGDKVTATATDEAGNVSEPTEATTTANPSDADENTLNTPAVTPVGDTNNLTEDEKAKVKEEVEKANPGLPTGTEVTVGNDGTVTITYPDGSIDTIPGTDTVVSTTPTPQTDAEKNDLTNPIKTPVGDTNNLTEDEKAKVKEEVEKSNPNLPTGTEVTVGNDGTVTITYPDGSVDTIPGTDTVVSTTPTPQTDAEKNDLTNPTKTPVTDVNNLTDDEKAKVKEEVEKSNPDLPSGTTITVGNDGTATITYPDGSTDTLTGTVTVIGTTPTPQTDAEKNDLANPTKTPVADTNNLTEDEKAKVKEEVEKSNPDLPTGTTITVGNDGTANITYPDGSTDTLTGTVTVIGTTPTPQTDAEKNDLTNPTKTPVGDTNNLTEDEKAKVKEEVEKSNPDLPTGTTVEVGNDGTVTVTYPDGSVDTISGNDTVATEPPFEPTPQTDAEKNGITNPTKTPVADTNNLTEDEKAKVKEEVEKANPGLPTGTTVEVGNDGTVTITYPDGSVDTIPGTDTVVSTIPTPQTDAEKNGITNPTKTPVADTNNLTEDEKAKVKEEVEKSNPDLPTGTTIVVGNGGSVTITYPDGSIDTIPGVDAVVPTTPTPQTDAEKNGITNPTKTPVADTNNLTEDEKAKVKEEVEKSNPDLPTGTTVEVGNDGTVTITYPDGSVDTIPGTDTVVSTIPTPQTDAEKNGITNPTKTPVADTNNLTEDEKAKVKEEVEKSNPGLPTGTTVEVGNDGTVTITYPDGSVDTISGTDTVTPNADTSAPAAPSVNVPNAGDKTVTGTAEPGSTVTVTFPDGTTVTTTADENGNFTVDVPAGVELKAGDKVTASATDSAGNTSDSTVVTVISTGTISGTGEGNTSTGTVNEGAEEGITEQISETASTGNTVNNIPGAVKESANDNKQAVLPNTGEESGMMSLMGLVGLAALGLLGFKRRRKEE